LVTPSLRRQENIWAAAGQAKAPAKPRVCSQSLLGTAHWPSHYCALNMTAQSKGYAALSWTWKRKKGNKRSHLTKFHIIIKKKENKTKQKTNRKNPKPILFQNKQRNEREDAFFFMASNIHLYSSYALTPAISP